jgi:hypothetical protein
MGTMIVIVCVGTGINLVLWAALYTRLDGLPLRIWSLAKKERVEGEGAALTLLQERTATKVAAIVKSLREYDEHVAACFRAQVAEAQVRARVVERQSSETGVALAAASALVRELRGLVDGENVAPRLASRPALVVAEGREAIAPEAEERLSGDDDLTSVCSRRLPSVLDGAGPTLVSPTSGKGGAR